MKQIAAGIAVVGALLMTPSPSGAAPINYAANGHYYDLVWCGASATAGCGWTWLTARDNAATQSYLGMQGHLATVTDAGENAFIVSNLITGPAKAVYGPYFGGFQQPSGPPNEPASNWQWVTLPNGVQEAWSYADWNSAEPNNSGGIEHFLHYTYNTAVSNAVKWNDVPNNTNNQIKAYVIEYQVPEPVSLLLLGSGLAAAVALRRRRA